jgi:hypothetical protein
MPYVRQIKRAHTAGDTAVQFNDRSMPARLAAIERAVASANVPREKVRSLVARALLARGVPGTPAATLARKTG